jgi:hypothetical protein
MSLISPGQYVESWRAPDSSLQVKCPLCNHWTANVPPACVTPLHGTSQTEWLDCACVVHNGQGQHGSVPECRCVGRFRIMPQGVTGRYQVAGVDYQTMAERIQAREAQEAEV